MAQDYGINLLFKDDLPTNIRLPAIMTQRAMVDFSVCEQVGAYVGLTMSSFSGTVRNFV